VIKLSSSTGRKSKIRYSKVVVNIPNQLIERFDRICNRWGFSRQEAIKQAMRDFIYDNTDENDVEPEQMKDAFKNMMLGIAEAAKEMPQEQKMLPKS